MEKYYDVLKRTPLFNEIEISEYKSMLKCLSATKESYKKNDFVLTEGGTNFKVGIILCGNLNVIKEDYYGNISILSDLSPSNLFAESYVCANIKELPVSVVAKSKSEILFIDFKQFINKDHRCLNCAFKEKLIENMLIILANKNIILNTKLEHITKRSTRKKVLSYLNEISRIKKSNSFTIPFNREELAAYLSVDRSALSKELSKMQAEKVLSYDRNNFTLNI